MRKIFVVIFFISTMLSPGLAETQELTLDCGGAGVCLYASSIIASGNERFLCSLEYRGNNIKIPWFTHVSTPDGNAYCIPPQDDSQDSLIIYGTTIGEAFTNATDMSISSYAANLLPDDIDEISSIYPINNLFPGSSVVVEIANNSNSFNFGLDSFIEVDSNDPNSGRCNNNSITAIVTGISGGTVDISLTGCLIDYPNPNNQISVTLRTDSDSDVDYAFIDDTFALNSDLTFQINPADIGDIANLEFAQQVILITLDQGGVVVDDGLGGTRDIDVEIEGFDYNTGQFGFANCPGAEFVNGVLVTPVRDPDFYTCRDCLNKGGIWTDAFGCVSYTPEGIFNTVIRVVLGMMGGVILLRMIILGYQYQFGDPSKVKDVSKDAIALISGILLLLFGVVFLRILGVNILDVVPAGFFG